MADRSKPAAETDAKGAFKIPTEGRDNDGVTSAKPTVINGSKDATVHRDPPGKTSGKDFDLNYKERDVSDGDPSRR